MSFASRSSGTLLVGTAVAALASSACSSSAGPDAVRSVDDAAKLAAMNNCGDGEIFTYDYVLQEDWAGGGRPFILGQVDTVRLDVDPTPGGRGDGRFVLPNAFTDSTVAWYIGLSKFVGPGSGDQPSDNFEIFAVRDQEIDLIYEVAKSAWKNEDVWFRNFFAGGDFSPTGTFTSGSVFFPKCAPANTPVRVGPEFGQIRYERRTDRVDWFFVPGYSAVRTEETPSPQLATPESNVIDAISASESAEITARRIDAGSFNLRDTYAPLPFWGRTELVQGFDLMVKSAWWHGLGEIFERYYYAKGRGLVDWYWYERTARLKSPPDSEGAGLGTTVLSGQPVVFYDCLRGDPQGHPIRIELEFATTAAQATWIDAIHAGRLPEPGDGISTGPVGALARSGGLTGRRTFIQRMPNLGPDLTAHPVELFVACDGGDTSTTSGVYFDVRYYPDPLIDARAENAIDPPKDTTTSVFDAVLSGWSRLIGLRRAPFSTQPQRVAWYDLSHPTWYPDATREYCLMWAAHPSAPAAPCSATTTSRSYAFNVDTASALPEGLYNLAVEIQGHEATRALLAMTLVNGQLLQTDKPVGAGQMGNLANGDYCADGLTPYNIDAASNDAPLPLDSTRFLCLADASLASGLKTHGYINIRKARITGGDCTDYGAHDCPGCAPSRTCSDYPNACGIGFSNGCTNTLACACSSGSCSNSTGQGTCVIPNVPVCANGDCETGEDNDNCPTDCCGPSTPCSVWRPGTDLSEATKEYCRRFSSDAGSSWGNFAWITQSGNYADYCSTPTMACGAAAPTATTRVANCETVYRYCQYDGASYRWLATCPVCSDGNCDTGENNDNCPTDCCGPSTPCSAWRPGTDGSEATKEYCRRFSSDAGSSWGDFGWITQSGNYADYCSTPTMACGAAAPTTTTRVANCEAVYRYCQFDGASYRWLATCPVCGDGSCDTGENNDNCPTDCCGPSTPCSAWRPGTDGSEATKEYCRRFSSDAGSSWGNFVWITQSGNYADYCSTPTMACGAGAPTTTTRVANCEAVYRYCQFDGTSYHWLATCP